MKVADGTYYPILEKGSGHRKRLILTTVKDQQPSVQIDLFEGNNNEIEDDKFIGSIRIEDIEAAEAGAADIELVVGLDEQGNLNARAKDLASGESQSLSISLDTFSDDTIYDMPDFELSDDTDSWASDDDASLPASPPMADSTPYIEEDDDYVQDAVESPRRKPLMLAFFIVIGVVIIVTLAILLHRVLQGPVVPPLEAHSPPRVEALEAEKTPEVEQTPVVEKTPEVEETSVAATTGEQEETGTETVRDSNVRDGPADSPGSQAGDELLLDANLVGGVWYWISWGDTLWDISANFYRNPWQYGRIAEENSIQNPDLIYAGSKIFIPESN